LLKIDVSKRRWISQLKSPEFDRNDITGFVFSKENPDRAFSYRVICKKDDKKNWQWTTDKDFELLRRELRIKVQPFSGQDIALSQANDNNNISLFCHSPKYEATRKPNYPSGKKG
jgi:hypothetical protein